MIKKILIKLHFLTKKLLIILKHYLTKSIGKCVINNRIHNLGCVNSE